MQPDVFPRVFEVVQKLKEVAAKYGKTPGQTGLESHLNFAVALKRHCALCCNRPIKPFNLDSSCRNGLGTPYSKQLPEANDNHQHTKPLCFGQTKGEDWI